MVLLRGTRQVTEVGRFLLDRLYLATPGRGRCLVQAPVLASLVFSGLRSHGRGIGHLYSG